MSANSFKLKVKKTRSLVRTKVKKVCECCGKEFYVEPYRGKGKYCSRQCADASKIIIHEPNVICDYCGKAFYLKPSQIAKNKTHCCSKQCMGLLRAFEYVGENNPNYGNRKDKIVEKCNGFTYYSIHVNNHPHSHKIKGIEVIREHRYVVEQNYNLFDGCYFDVIDGKHYLKSNVDVHHKNQITTDNRIENLQPLFRSEHTTEHNKDKIILRNPNNGRITGVIKQGELLENHIAYDNQQPSINRNIDKGSTTNSRVLTSNVEDSNADTSALPNIN